MTAKEYLSQAYRIDQQIQSKVEQVSSLKYLAAKATAVISDMPGSASRNTHRMEDTITKIVDLEDEIDAGIDALVDLKRDIIQVINQVGSSEYRLLLEKRYLRCEPWEEIAVAMQYSLRYIHKLHGEALKALLIPAKKIKTGH